MDHMKTNGRADLTLGQSWLIPGMYIIPVPELGQRGTSMI